MPLNHRYEAGLRVQGALTQWTVIPVSFKNMGATHENFIVFGQVHFPAGSRGAGIARTGKIGPLGGDRGAAPLPASPQSTGRLAAALSAGHLPRFIRAIHA